MQAYDWQAIVGEYGSLVWQTAYRLLGNPADAADCFQETFLGALEVSRRQHVRNLPGLLARLATTRAIDRLRQKSRQDRHQAGAGGDGPVAEGASPLSIVETQEITGQMREAIAQLPAQEARVFCLRYLNDMSYRQIARELDIGINVVGVSLHRARARLRKALGAAQVEDEVSHDER